MHIAHTKELELYEGHFVQSRSQLCRYYAGYNDDKIASVITMIPLVICAVLHISHVAVFYANGPRQRMSTQIGRLRVWAYCYVLNCYADMQCYKVILWCNTCLFLKSAKKDEQGRLTNSREGTTHFYLKIFHFFPFFFFLNRKSILFQFAVWVTFFSKWGFMHYKGKSNSFPCLFP